jgi:hypothetical protein
MQEDEMKNALSWLPLVILSALPLALQCPSLWARSPSPGDVVELGDLKSRVPADWVEEEPYKARYYKQYRLEPIDDDKDYAQVTIRFLGKGNHDTAAAQVQRWKAMFFPPKGNTIREAARVRQLKINGAAATYLDVRGDYKGIPGDNASPRQNFRLLGIYLDTPKGPYTICMFGPAATVEFYRKQFEDWVKAFK